MLNENNNLTKRQKEILNFIVTYIKREGVSPSLKEIASHIRSENASSAQYFVEELVTKGFLSRNKNKSRGLTPINTEVSVPLLGNIAAGRPIEAIENPVSIGIPSSIKLSPVYSHYALKVQGDSMEDMGVLDGDVVIIRHQFDAESGQPVVAITEDGATLKILKKTSKGMHLEPKNKKYSPIYPQHLEIRGRYIGLIRGGIDQYN